MPPFGASGTIHPIMGLSTKKPPPVRIGAAYTAAHSAPTVWRAERFLADGVHVVLVSDDEPTRRKTVSAWVLPDTRYFVPAGR